MIKIKAEKEALCTEIDLFIQGQYWSYTFRWNCSSEVYAQLLAEKLNYQLGEKLRKLQQEAYDAGFRDAKAKRKKETWFRTWW